MKRNTVLWFVVAAVTVGIFLVLLGGCTPQESRVPSMKQGQAGTTLKASKSAEGFWEKTITYDWTIKKEATLNDDGTITYTLTATRKKVSETNQYGVRGTITVTNGGEKTTENLKLVDQVEYKTGAGQFQPLSGASQTIQPGELGPGEAGTYRYEIIFTPVPGALYRNSVKVTITNHSGNLGEEFGPEPKTDFSLPGAPTITYVDQTANVRDELQCPDGFTCTIGDPDYPDWENIGAGNIDDEYTWTVTYTLTPNQGSTVCDTVTFQNTVTLTENDTEEIRTADSNIQWNCAQISCWKDETAWAAGTRYVRRGNWATYTPYGGEEKTVTLYAGQTMEAGTVKFSAPNNGNVTITITLNEGWRLDPDEKEPVKVQGYNSTPPPVNPSPGLFTTYKGSALSFTVPQFSFYGVHVDVEREVPCEL